MKEPFTIQRAHIAATDWYTLKRELFSHTGNEHEASSILRSLESIGSDPTIDHFEVVPSPNPNRGVYPGAAEWLWKVEPVRSRGAGSAAAGAEGEEGARKARPRRKGSA